MAGKLTHEQQLRTFERKDDIPKEREIEAGREAPADAPEPTVRHPEARSSEFPVSRGGVQQESRHNKHNDPPKGG